MVSTAGRNGTQRLIQSSNLPARETAYTGGSVPVLKQAEPVDADAPSAGRKCMVYILPGNDRQSRPGRVSDLTESAEKEPKPYAYG
jgi:hypothetical protein